MARYTIFYSWQSDSDDRYNRNFIQQALESAAVEVAAAPGTRDRPKVDFGMERVPGSPEVATIMFRKIRQSAIFVGDVSLVGGIAREGKSTKRTPNPNVLTELGFAAGTVGWDRIICVLNQAMGRVEKLPIDLLNRRWPIRYKLGPQNFSETDTVQATLTADLKAAIQAVVCADHEAVFEVEKRLDLNSILVVYTYRIAPWFNSGPPGRVTIGAASGIDILTLNVAVPRLLDLGMIASEFNSQAGLYAYHWTFLAKRYIEWKWPGTTERWPATEAQ